MSKIRGGEDTYSTSGEVDDIFVLSANITYVFFTGSYTFDLSLR